MEINRRKSLDLSNMRNDRHLKMLEKLHKIDSGNIDSKLI